MSVIAFDIASSVPASQPAPRVISGSTLARLCRHNPTVAAALAVDIRYGRVELVRPTATQAQALTGTDWAGYDRAKAVAARIWR